MFVLNLGEIPVIDNIEGITLSQIEHLKRFGLCYLKIEKTNDDFDQHLTDLKAQAFTLFRSPDSQKQTYTPNASDLNWTKKNLSYGYNDRRSSFEHLETFRQVIGTTTNPPFQDHTKTINLFKKKLVDDLATNLIKKMMRTIPLNDEDDKYHQQIFNNLNTVLSFVYYSPKEKFKRMSLYPNLNPHKDIDLMTVIILEKPGLQFWADGAWIDILPKEGYMVLLFGYDMDLITKGYARSCLHYVRMKKNEERLSILFFVSINNELFSKLGFPNSKERYSKHNIEDRMPVKMIFHNLICNANIAWLIISSIFVAKEFFENDQAMASISQLNSRSLPKSIVFSFSGLILLNAFLQTLRMTYFKRMSMDYLQHPVRPQYLSDSQAKAYELGQSSLSFFGMTQSFIEPAAYSHRSLWNAGVIKSFITK